MLEVLCPFDVFNTTRSKSFLVKNTAVFVVEQDGELSAFVNRCPHQGIPLDWGNDQFLDVDGELIQCATHGALFDIPTGHCLSGPCSGQSLTQILLQIKDNNVYIETDGLS